MVIQHNLLAMNSQRQLGIVNTRKAKSTEKLSSGYRINRSADDAAGLAISEKMRRQIRGLTQAAANAQDGISLVQIADGAMAEVHDMLHRGSELAIKAANGTLSDDDRAYIDAEIQQLKQEIDEIKEKTTFNEIQVLKGKEVEVSATQGVTSTGGAVVLGGLPSWVAVGGTVLQDKLMTDTYKTTETYSYDDSLGVVQTDNFDVEHSAVTLDFSAMDVGDFGAKLAELTKDNSGFYSTCCTCTAHYSIQFVNGGGNSVSNSGNHQIYKVDLAGATSSADVVNKIKNAVGTNPNGHYTKMEYSGSKVTVYDNRSKNNATNTASNQIAALGGNNFSWTSWNGLGAGDTAEARSGYGVFGPGVAVDGNSLGQTPAQPERPKDIQLQVGAEQGQLLDIKLPSISCKVLKIKDTGVLTTEHASNAIQSFKSALGYVAEERSRMGAYQNRLEHTIKNLDNVVENTTAAESLIRDTDMATEMVAFSKDNILSQVGQSMLAQANQSKQGILSLLG